MPSTTSSEAYHAMVMLLVALRRKRGLTQAELSAKLGKPQPFVSNIERGVRRIDVIEFCAIVRALDGDPTVEFRKLAAVLPRDLRI